VSTTRPVATYDTSVLAAWIIPIAAVVAAAGAGFVWLACAVDAVRAGDPLPAQPLALAAALHANAAPWPSPTGWSGAGLLTAGTVTAIAGTAARLTRGIRARSDVDRRTRYLAAPDERRRLGPKARTEQTRRLVPGLRDLPGLPIAVAIPDRQPVLQGFEDVSVDVWGPRQGKTATRAVPALLAAPGPGVATSNKRDLYDTTAGLRAERGQVWCFDPQSVATAGSPTFVFNPLAAITTAVAAQRLAALFVADTREPNARTDPQWDTSGADLLAWLMLAAAVDGRAPGDVWGWVTDPRDDTPVDLLRAHGHEGPANAIDGVQHQPEKMRGSVYGTAQRMARPLINPQLLAWVTPAPGLPLFDPQAFVHSRDTLYALSREGAGSCGAIVAALTSAVCEAAEQAAMANPDRSGRLAVPMVVVLDEAANVCRWPELPTLYSHYGSRGILLMTFLQSHSQGVAVWGEEGMRTLWSAATIRVYGGGVADQRWLSELSELIGDHDETYRTVTVRRGERSVSFDTRQRRTLTTAQLMALPERRAVLLAGGRPVIIEPQPWWKGPQAATIRAAAQKWADDHAGSAVLHHSRRRRFRRRPGGR